ncbi:MAG: hypothetical protein PVI20_11290 [Desulfobacteraceae bacterium]
MPKSLMERPYIRLGLLGFLVLMLFSSCQSRKEQIPQEKPAPPRIGKMVVVGFLPAMSPWDEPNMVRSPVSGAVFFGEPVPEQVVSGLTVSLFNRIVKERRFELISPGQARGVYSSLKLSDVVGKEIEIIQKIGLAFSADAALIGYVYRFREREGTDYAVNRAASVAFDLYLISPQDGVVFWKGKFDKTQQHLSQNILDAGTFMKGQGRWMTAEKLAEIGLEDVLGSLFEAVKGKKED